MAGSVPGTAQIVDHNFGTPSGQFKRISLSKTRPGSGNNRHAIIKANLILVSGSSRYRHGLPKIVNKSAFLVGTFTLERHFHRKPDTDVIEFTVGKICHHPSPAFKLDHTVNGRGINGYRQQIAGIGLHFSGHIGKLIILLAVKSPAFRVDTYVGFRKLGCIAFPAFTAHQAQDHFVFTP